MYKVIEHIFIKKVRLLTRKPFPLNFQVGTVFFFKTIREKAGKSAFNIIDAGFRFRNGSLPIGALLTGKCGAISIRF